MHGSVEDTKLSTNKQHSLSRRGGRLERMGPGAGVVVGEGEEEPERGAGAFVAGGKGMRRSEEAKVSEETVRRNGGGEGPRKLGMS